NRPAELHKLYVEATLDDYPVITEVILPSRVDKRTLTHLRDAAGVKILDVGTGAGFALVHYAKRFPKAEVVGLDINQSCVEEAQSTIQAAMTDPDFKYKKIEVL